jgi:hypothetical protein
MREPANMARRDSKAMFGLGAGRRFLRAVAGASIATPVAGIF